MIYETTTDGCWTTTDGCKTTAVVPDAYDSRKM